MTDNTSGGTENFAPDSSDDAGRLRREHANAMLANVAKGDERAFAELYRATSPRVFGVIVRMIHDRGEAEDILQEVFATAWRRADTFDPARGSAVTWLVTLGRNRTIDRMRQHREELLGENDTAEIADESPTPAVAAESSRSGCGSNIVSTGSNRSRRARSARPSSPARRIANWRNGSPCRSAR
ncbi:RNA polymerase sigma-70 factor, ECF subfamily (plasmid) [Caballeronia sp. S22]